MVQRYSDDNSDLDVTDRDSNSHVTEKNSNNDFIAWTPKGVRGNSSIFSTFEFLSVFFINLHTDPSSMVIVCWGVGSDRLRSDASVSNVVTTKSYSASLTVCVRACVCV